ncbi:MFS transporter [Rhodococcus artemisiae]|uniref:MFS transporter n=1 Tax=Rhodococcus artemisiae TaxID=714159 RepID=A0ABU7LC45_9NOCA|nr:MFS transporter [Rhodococcus artemisiae]MEE2058482.1 MFS transporter [Rhodococcus artemisiae]
MTSLRRGAILVVVCLAELLVLLDNTVVNVALPSMGVSLGAGFSGLQWIVDAYTLTFAGLLLACGHLGDRFGRRRVMLIGLAGIAVMSVGGALATSVGMVVAARAAMGVFAAAVFPATLALVTITFTTPKARAAAIAVWTAMAGFAVAIGPTAGGWLLTHFSWHSVFWMNVPIALAILVAARFVLPESRTNAHGRLDVLGLVLSFAGIVTLVWAIVEGPRHGWVSPTTIGAFVFGAAMIAVFVWRETRVSNPVLDVRLFRNRRFSLPALSIAVAYFSMFGFLFLITQYFQGIQEYSPLEFGIRSLPFAAAVLIAAPAATMLAQRVGTTAVLIGGFVILATGMGIAGQVTVESPYVGIVLISMILMGLGLAIVQGPATESIMGSVELDEAGVGSAVNDTTREVGGALGVAVLGSIVASAYTDRVAPLVDTIPDSMMDPQQKDFARQSVLTVLEIRKHDVPTMFSDSKDHLIFTMKAAALDGFQIASYATVGLAIACAIAVAALLPWKRPERGSVLLGWMQSPSSDETPTTGT